MRTLIISLLLCSSAYAQELEVIEPAINLEPEHSYVLEDTEDLLKRNMDEDNLARFNEVDPDESYSERVQRHSRLGRMIREFSGCLVTPIPIDDYYVGCYWTFELDENEYRVIWND